MTHLLRIIPDSKLVRGYVITAADISAIDAKTACALNGDEGGSWTAAAAITIGGAGVIIAGLWTMSSAGVNVTTGVSTPITFARGTVDDYFGFDPAHTGASPVVRSGFVEFFSAIPGSVAWLGGLIVGFHGAKFITPLYVYSGASKIDSIDISWRVRESHANIPQYLPQVRAIAVDDEGNVTPLRSKDATTDANGFQFLPTPASGAAYYNGSLAQAWTYTCNVVLPMDSSKYVYYLEFIEESGTNSWVSAGNQFFFAQSHFSLVTIFDGRN